MVYLRLFFCAAVLACLVQAGQRKTEALPPNANVEEGCYQYALAVGFACLDAGDTLDNCWDWTYFHYKGCLAAGGLPDLSSL